MVKASPAVRARMARLRSDFAELERRLDHDFIDRDRFFLALTHSTAQEGRESPDNRALAFVGDAVIELAVRLEGFEKNPLAKRGKLSSDADHVVPNAQLAARARTLGLGEWLDMGAGEAGKAAGEATRLADAFEALAAAMYLDSGPAAFPKLRRLLAPVTT